MFSSTLCNDDLEKYYHAEVEMSRGVTKRSIERVMPVIERIMEYINRNDPRFDKNLYYVGSQYQGLKVARADEFDFSVPVLGLPTMHWTTYTPLYYNFNRPFQGDLDTLPDDLQIVKTNVALPSPPTGYITVHPGQIQSPAWQDRDRPMIYEGDIIPFLVKHTFKKLLQEALRELYPGEKPGKPRLARKANGPAMMLRIPHTDRDDPNMEEISVDLSPCLPTQSSFPSSTGWPRNKQWPSRDKVAAIQRVGINDKAKKAFYWMKCYANCEKELLSNIDKDGGCRKKCHRIMKRVREQFWCKTNQPGVSSYILKNILLWECEAYPHASDWNQDMLATRFMSMTKRLLDSLAQNNVGRYFEPAFNLMAFENPTRKLNLKMEIGLITDFYANPPHYLRKALVKGA